MYGLLFRYKFSSFSAFHFSISRSDCDDDQVRTQNICNRKQTLYHGAKKDRFTTAVFTLARRRRRTVIKLGLAFICQTFYQQTFGPYAFYPLDLQSSGLLPIRPVVRLIFIHYLLSLDLLSLDLWPLRPFVHQTFCP